MKVNRQGKVAGRETETVFVIDDEAQAIIRDALMHRINAIQNAAGDLRHVTTDERAAVLLLDEAKRVGAVLDGLSVRE